MIASNMLAFYLLTKVYKLYSVFEAELADVIPICHTTIAGTRIVGRLTAGCVPPLSHAHMFSTSHSNMVPSMQEP